MKSAIVLADFYPDNRRRIVGKLSFGADRSGNGKTVFGARAGCFGNPFALQTLARSKVDVLVALGCVIRGETRHFDIVSDIALAAFCVYSWILTLPSATRADGGK